MENDLIKFCEKVVELNLLNVKFVTITLTNVRGSAPQNIGAKMIVSNSEILFGTIGGGKIEAHCIQTARNLLNSQGTAVSYIWNLQKDIGMTCGGEVSYLFEITNINKWDITIFGAGHVSQSLARTLLGLECNLTIIDHRIEWLNKLPKNNNLRVIHSEDMSSEVKNIDNNSFVVVMTMGHGTDVPILEKALRDKTFPYLGVIGSKAKRNQLEKELLSRGITQSKLNDFICPMGEDFGNNSPAEISISICAQLLKVRDSSKKKD